MEPKRPSPTAVMCARRSRIGASTFHFGILKTAGKKRSGIPSLLFPFLFILFLFLIFVDSG